VLPRVTFQRSSENLRKRRTHQGASPDHEQRRRADALRALVLSFAEVGRRLGVTNQAAWHMIVIGLPAHTAGVHCSACQAIVSTRHFQRRTVGEVLYRPCLARRPDAPFALRLRSYRLGAGMIRSQLEAAAGLPAGVVKYFDERGVKPHASTWAPLAKALRAPDLERLGREQQEDQTGRH
jgi:hypothetical protein